MLWCCELMGPPLESNVLFWPPASKKSAFRVAQGHRSLGNIFFKIEVLFQERGWLYLGLFSWLTVLNWKRKKDVLLSANTSQGKTPDYKHYLTQEMVSTEEQMDIKELWINSVWQIEKRWRKLTTHIQ